VPSIRTENYAVIGSRTLARAAYALAFVGLLAIARDSGAQVLRTPVPLPALPKLAVPLGGDSMRRDPLQALDPQRLNQLREVRLRALVRMHGDVLDTDPRGAPVVRREILGWAISEDGIARISARGFTIGRRTALGELGGIVVLVAPPGLGTRDALRELRRADPAGTYEFNHLYFESGEASAPAGAAIEPPPDSLADTVTPADARAGMVDGGIDAGHPAFARLSVHAWGCADRPVPSAHGTAVASLLAGRSADFRGAAPGATLYVADVFCGLPTGGAADSIVAALAWLLGERLPVINVSLVGPPNAVLERVVRLATSRGVLLVAAVGNDGPAAPPAYPASYPGVIAVTAVDAKGRVLLEAGRALHVDFAAPGADMLAAVPPDSYAAVRGTSFAAPLVAGLAARDLRSRPIPPSPARRSAVYKTAPFSRAARGRPIMVKASWRPPCESRFPPIPMEEIRTLVRSEGVGRGLAAARIGRTS